MGNRVSLGIFKVPFRGGEVEVELIDTGLPLITRTCEPNAFGVHTESDLFTLGDGAFEVRGTLQQTTLPSAPQLSEKPEPIGASHGS